MLKPRSQKYLVSIFDIDWSFSQSNGACNSFAELHLDLRGFSVKRFLDAGTVRDVEQLGDEKALFTHSTHQEQTSTIAVYLQCVNSITYRIILF